MINFVIPTLYVTYLQSRYVRRKYKLDEYEIYLEDYFTVNRF